MRGIVSSRTRRASDSTADSIARYTGIDSARNADAAASDGYMVWTTSGRLLEALASAIARATRASRSSYSAP